MFFSVNQLENNDTLIVKSSRPEVFCKKGVLRSFTKFTVKHLCQSPFFKKVAGLGPATLLKKRLWYRCFTMNFAKFLRTPFLTEHLRGLLLNGICHSTKGLLTIYGRLIFGNVIRRSTL